MKKFLFTGAVAACLLASGFAYADGEVTFRIPDEFVDHEREGASIPGLSEITGLDDDPSGRFVIFPVNYLANKIPGYVGSNGKLVLAIHGLLSVELPGKINVNPEYGQSPCRTGYQCAPFGQFCAYARDPDGLGLLGVMFDLASSCEGTIGETAVWIGLALKANCPVCDEGNQLRISTYFRGSGYYFQYSFDGQNLTHFEEINDLIKRNVETWVVRP